MGINYNDKRIKNFNQENIYSKVTKKNHILMGEVAKGSNFSIKKINISK